MGGARIHVLDQPAQRAIDRVQLAPLGQLAPAVGRAQPEAHPWLSPASMKPSTTSATSSSSNVKPRLDAASRLPEPCRLKAAPPAPCRRLAHSTTAARRRPCARRPRRSCEQDARPGGRDRCPPCRPLRWRSAYVDLPGEAAAIVAALLAGRRRRTERREAGRARDNASWYCPATRADCRPPAAPWTSAPSARAAMTKATSTSSNVKPAPGPVPDD